MIKHKKIKIGKKYIDAFLIKLLTKNLILLKGAKGYIMCGYLDLAVAEKFGDAAVRITGVSTIAEALNTTVSSCTTHAQKIGIKEGQLIKEVLKIIV
jgi:uncharacterized protein YunC (DUF1805 family)